MDDKTSSRLRRYKERFRLDAIENMLRTLTLFADSVKTSAESLRAMCQQWGEELDREADEREEDSDG